MTPEEVIAQAIEDDDRNNTVSLDLPDDEFHAALLKSSVKAILTALSTAGFVVVEKSTLDLLLKAPSGETARPIRTS